MPRLPKRIGSSFLESNELPHPGSFFVLLQNFHFLLLNKIDSCWLLHEVWLVPGNAHGILPRLSFFLSRSASLFRGTREEQTSSSLPSQPFWDTGLWSPGEGTVIQGAPVLSGTPLLKSQDQGGVTLGWTCLTQSQEMEESLALSKVTWWLSWAPGAFAFMSPVLHKRNINNFIWWLWWYKDKYNPDSFLCLHYDYIHVFFFFFFPWF